MPPSKRKPCKICGRQTQKNDAICNVCCHKIKNNHDDKCCVCNEKLVRMNGNGFAKYCRGQCSTVIADLRNAYVSRVLNSAIKKGVIKKAKGQVCVDCGGVATDYDHREYMKPLAVAPVCRSCNQKRGPVIDAVKFVAHHASIDVSEVPTLMKKIAKAVDIKRQQMISGQRVPGDKWPNIFDYVSVAAAQKLGADATAKPEREAA